MKGRKILDAIQHEVNVLKGEEAKNKIYSSQHTFPDEQAAQEAFTRSKEKLFHVDRWSDLSSFTADFMLHDQAGNRATRHHLQVGDFIKIDLPGPMPENWVEVVHLANEEQMAEFTVRPSNNPQQKEDDKIEHFFQQKARSTFRVVLEERTITASEIGQNEAINNQEPESGDRTIINTLIAEAGWLFHQPIQWKVLTDYLVHQDV
ncbi:hypothetical protein [Spirosoma sp.]|uniref:hypothetical protein n=1 Tax=Spirosoma sp. TaxID=1899569 RepID=UPI003B3A2839